MYALNEIGLIPSVLSDIEHRSDVNPYINSKLPIFVSPMTCILNGENFKTFYNSRVMPILPRGIKNCYDFPGDGWAAYSLEEFKDTFCNKEFYEENWNGKVLIDVANGHMKCIYDYVKEAKSIWGDKLTVMVGNIANPDTYLECCKAGVDYVRVGIGGGNACTTGVQTGIHASMHWLLTKINKLRKVIKYANGLKWYHRIIGNKLKRKAYKYKCDTLTKIIADGGIDTIDKAIKCLALGADYVMMGKLFAQTEEACGETRLGFKDRYLERKYYGMASEQGQKDISGGIHKNAEGIETWIPIKYTLNEYLDKFEAALRSCMSYCGAHNLDDFVGKVKWEPMTECEFKSYYK